MKNINNTYKLVLKDTKGFSLIELLVAMVIATILLGAVYVSYSSQQENYIDQNQVVEMQQNIRAAMYVLEHDIRMAGYDPTGHAGAGIRLAEAGRLSISCDLNGDGDLNDVNERLDFGFTNADDSDHDGIPDSPPKTLARQSNGGGFQPFAENIDAVEFRYLDAAGNPTTVINSMRAVQVSLLARSSQPDFALGEKLTNQTTYKPDPNDPSKDWGPYNDAFRRRMLIATIQLRNMSM